MDNIHEVIEKFEATDKEIKKKRFEFECTIRDLTLENDSYSAKILERANTLLDRLIDYNKKYRPNKQYLCGEIKFDDELSASAKLKNISSVSETYIEFWAEESWRYGGYAEGYITIPKVYLEADIDNLGWFNNLCQEEANRRKVEEIQEKIRQIEELSAKIEQLQKERGIESVDC